MAITEDRSRDLDETRRLLYMTLVAPRTKRYNLAGTLINALIHHSGILPGKTIAWAEENTLMDRVVRLVDGDTEDGDLEWVYEQIERINGELSNAEPTVS